MGHADSRTTMRYLHHKSLDADAEADLLGNAFPPAGLRGLEQRLRDDGGVAQ